MRDPCLDQLARRVVTSKAAPAAVCAVGFRANGGWCYGTGAAGTLWPTSAAPVTPDTIFDLASLTKPFVAVAVATEFAVNRTARDTPLRDWLPELGNCRVVSVSLERLLAHRSGLIPHLELFRRQFSGRPWQRINLLTAAANATVDAEPLTDANRAIYSDLGYLLVGAAVERRFTQPLDRWMSDRLPWFLKDGVGSVRSWAGSDAQFRARCAPTEIVPGRGGLVWGRVHDENAWTLGGCGSCGHAGLFGTARGVARFGAAALDAYSGRTSVLPHRAVRFAATARIGGSLAAGFDRKSGSSSAAGSIASSDTFGHLGFTGTSLWCDPQLDVVTVLLTNRVCPDRRNARLRSMRPALHDALFEWASRTQTGHPLFSS